MASVAEALQVLHAQRLSAFVDRYDMVDHLCWCHHPMLFALFTKRVLIQF